MRGSRPRAWSRRPSSRRPRAIRTHKPSSTLLDRVLERVRAIPGVEAAGITSNIALSGFESPATVSAAGRAAPDEAAVVPSVVGVTPGYFEAMATPLVRGRYFADERPRKHAARGDRGRTPGGAALAGRGSHRQGHLSRRLRTLHRRGRCSRSAPRGTDRLDRVDRHRLLPAHAGAAAEAAAVDRDQVRRRPGGRRARAAFGAPGDRSRSADRRRPDDERAHGTHARVAASRDESGDDVRGGRAVAVDARASTACWSASWPVARARSASAWPWGAACVASCSWC